MRWRRQIVLPFLAALLLAAPAAAGAEVMYWGGTIKGDVYGLPSEAPTSAAVLNRFEADAGKSITFVNTGQSWVTFNSTTMDAAIEAGAIPLVTMGLDSGVTLREVIEGKQDDRIRAWARTAREFGYPFLFRPWWEMNGDWYTWGRDPEFIAAWRHFHDLVVAEGATNVTWAWVVNTIWSDPASDPAPYYPGGAYVDWVGMDAYNWGRNEIQPDRWLTAEESIQPTLEVLEQVAPGKPVCICESASTEIGEGEPDEDKALWIHEMLDEYLPSEPSIKAYLWFNWNVEGGKIPGRRYDWPIESTPEAEAAFREGIQSDTFLSVLPPLTPLAKVPMPAWPPPPPPPPSEPNPPEVPGRSVDARGTSPSPEAPSLTATASSPIALGAASPSARRGGAILPITVAGPGKLRFSGHGLRLRILPSRHLAPSPLSKAVDGAGELRLEIRAAAGKLRRLRAAGEARLALTVRFTPDRGNTVTATTRITVTAGQ
jgi:Glycosyl hydrolase family 26